MSVQVFRDNAVFVNEVFANGRRLFSVFSHTLVQVPESIAYITCIAQVTLKFINYSLLVNNRRFNLMHFQLLLDLITNKNRLNDSVGLQAEVFQLFTD